MNTRKPHENSKKSNNKSLSLKKIYNRIINYKIPVALEVVIVFLGFVFGGYGAYNTYEDNNGIVEVNGIFIYNGEVYNETGTVCINGKNCSTANDGHFSISGIKRGYWKANVLINNLTFESYGTLDGPEEAIIIEKTFYGYSKDDV